MSKLDSAGNFAWAKTLGAGGFDGAEGIALDPSGNVYTTGNFVGSVDFDPGPGTFNLMSDVAQDAYVWKLDSAGNLVWAKRLGGRNFEGVGT